MTEQELRQLVRSVIEQQPVRLKADLTSARGRGSSGPESSWDPASAGPPDPTVIPLPVIRDHASHALFMIPAQGEACIIEPGVTCNHCGYCKSYGH